MNQYVTGAAIRELRQQKNMTQLQLAQKLNVSDKAVSKWETGKGYPDITLLEAIADAFGISVTELISGNRISNRNVSANMMKSGFCVCPVCGNVIHTMGEAVIQCHGVQLLSAEPEPKLPRLRLLSVEPEQKLPSVFWRLSTATWLATQYPSTFILTVSWVSTQRHWKYSSAYVPSSARAAS